MISNSWSVPGLHSKTVSLFFCRSEKQILVNHDLSSWCLCLWKIKFERIIDVNTCFCMISNVFYLTIFIFYFLAHIGLKAQVNFFNCLSFISPFVCKLFTFSSSSPEPLGQFQPNLAQRIFCWRGFKFVQWRTMPFF